MKQLYTLKGPGFRMRSGKHAGCEYTRGKQYRKDQIPDGESHRFEQVREATAPTAPKPVRKEKEVNGDGTE